MIMEHKSYVIVRLYITLCICTMYIVYIQLFSLYHYNFKK